MLFKRARWQAICGFVSSVNLVGLTCLSVCLSNKRKRSSSCTHVGRTCWPCCRALSNCSFSSRSTRSSSFSRLCRVRVTCKSSSRSREVRRSPSRPLTCICGCVKEREQRGENSISDSFGSCLCLVLIIALYCIWGVKHLWPVMKILL